MTHSLTMHRNGVKETCGRDWKASPSSVWTRKDLKRHLYRAVANVNILEGIRFYVSFACSFAFGELNSWKDLRKSYHLLQEMKSASGNNTNIINNWRKGDDPEMKEIVKEEEQWTYSMFDRCVNEEKVWAEYLFKDGSMIGLNDKLLHQYVEWIANKRMKSIGLKPVYDIPARNNPLPWTQHWISSRVFKSHHKKQR